LLKSPYGLKNGSNKARSRDSSWNLRRRPRRPPESGPSTRKRWFLRRGGVGNRACRGTRSRPRVARHGARDRAASSRAGGRAPWRMSSSAAGSRAMEREADADEAPLAGPVLLDQHREKLFLVGSPRPRLDQRRWPVVPDAGAGKGEGAARGERGRGAAQCGRGQGAARRGGGHGAGEAAAERATTGEEMGEGPPLWSGK
jgi:hypothetical protein